MKNWIWDFDGTLFNSYPRMHRALLAALAEQGVVPPHEESLNLLKISMRESVRHYSQAHGLDPLRIKERYLQIETNSDEMPAPYPGIKALCEKHVAQGGRHFVYTHRNGKAWDMLAFHGMDDLFSDAITEDDAFPHKPAPDALLHMIAKHALDPADTVMIGDRDIDVLAAKNAGIAGCLFDPEHFFDAYETHLRADTAQGLWDLLHL